MKKIKCLTSFDRGNSESTRAISKHCNLGTTAPEFQGIYLSLSKDELEGLQDKLLKVTIVEAGKWRPNLNNEV